MKKIDPIYEALAALYLRLTFTEDRASYKHYPNYKTDVERIVAIDDEAEEIQKMIGLFIGEKSGILDTYMQTWTDNKNIQAKVPSLFPQNLELKIWL